MKKSNYFNQIATGFVLAILLIQPILATGKNKIETISNLPEKSVFKFDKSIAEGNKNNIFRKSILNFDTPQGEITPGKIVKGVASQPISFISPKCENWENQKFKITAESKKTLTDNKISITEDVIFQKIDSGKCRAVAFVSVANNTKSDKYKIKFFPADKEDEVIEAALEIIGEVEQAREPIPPGLEPQVDVMWAVVPNKITKDNFGPQIAKRFYCIEVVIGNNSGYSLQIATVGFKLGPIGKAATVMAKTIEAASQNETFNLDAEFKKITQDCNSEKGEKLITCTSNAIADLKTRQERIINAIKNQSAQLTDLSRIAYSGTIPVSSYQIARGSASHGQFWNVRGLLINTIKALGPILTGFTPFLNARERVGYAEGVNLFNNPIEKGLEAVFPDETIPQLQRLDDQILRDGMIISNNRQIRTRAFIPKHLLQLDKKYTDNPIVITQSLGTLYLIGDQIEYRNRINVSSSPSGEVIPPPTVNPTYEKVFNQGVEELTVNFLGANLKDAQISSDDPVNIKTEVTENSTGTSVTAKITVTKTAVLGNHTLRLSTSRGSVDLPIIITQPLPEIDAASKSLNVTKDKADGKTVPNGKVFSYQTEEKKYQIEIKGDFLQEATLEPQPVKKPDGTVEKNLLFVEDKSYSYANGSMTATIVVPAGTKSGDYPFIIKNKSNENSTEAQRVTFTVNKKPEPQIGLVTYEKKADGTDNKPAAYQSAKLSYNFTIAGENLQDATTNATDIFITPSKDGKQIVGRVDIASNTALGKKQFALTFFDNESQNFEIEVEQQNIIVNETPPIFITLAPNQSKDDIKLSGRNFRDVNSDATSISVDNADWKIERIDAATNDESLTLKITAPGEEKFKEETTLNVVLKNSNKREFKLQIKVSPPKPEPSPSPTP